jgi:hypothetical protein
MSEDISTQEDYQFEKLSNLAMSKDMTCEQAKYVFSHGIDEINYHLAQNLNTPSEILVSLSQSKYHNTALDLSTSDLAIKHPSFPVDELKKFVNTKNKKAVAESPNLTPELAIKLYDFKDEEIRNSLAGNPLTPVDILVELSESSSYNSYAMALAVNPSVPYDLLKSFISSKESWILPFVLKNPSVDMNDFEDIIVTNINLMKVLARQEYTPLSILNKIYEQSKKLSAKESKNIITSIARNKANTDLSMLEDIFKNADHHVRLHIATNPNISHELIHKLLAYDMDDIHYLILGNSATPMNVLKKYASDSKYSGVVAANPNVTLECLDKLSIPDLSYNEVGYLLKKEFITPEIIKKLILEGNEWDSVSELAYKHPLACIDDIVSRTYEAEAPNYTIFYLLDREDKAFPLFKKYIEEKYETDITNLPNTLICDLMNWDISFV